MCDVAERLWNNGRDEGREEGETIINKLISFLIKDNRIQDLEKSTVNREYQKQLLVEYGIIGKS